MSGLTVSVVIPVYNRAALIERAIMSVLNQTLPPAEVLVVDDGSSDGTREIVSKIAERDPRVCLIIQEHQGAPAARNRGIEHARSDLIAFQDSDDEWLPEFISTLVGAVDGPRNVVFCSFERISSDGKIEVLPQRSRVLFPGYRLKRRNIISTQTVLINRVVFEEYRFDTSLPRLQDWDLWLTMSSTVRFKHVDAVLARQYLQADSISAKPDALVVALKAIIAKHWKKLLIAPIVLARNVLFVERQERAQRARVRALD